MDICFVEYTIIPERREPYLRCMDQLIHTALAPARSIELYEGSDQPNLFVEIWRDFDVREFAAFQKMRQEPSDSDWAEVVGFVSGGAKRMHIWHFRNVYGHSDFAE